MTELHFPGNEPGESVSLPTPTRAALILSAKQWAIAGRERLLEVPLDKSGDQDMDFKYMYSCFERIEKALVELEGLEK